MLLGEAAPARPSHDRCRWTSGSRTISLTVDAVDDLSAALGQYQERHLDEVVDAVDGLGDGAVLSRDSAGWAVATVSAGRLIVVAGAANRSSALAAGNAAVAASGG
jgi:hypothetical protein